MVTPTLEAGEDERVHVRKEGSARPGGAHGEYRHHRHVIPGDAGLSNPHHSTQHEDPRPRAGRRHSSGDGVGEQFLKHGGSVQKQAVEQQVCRKSRVGKNV